MEITQGSINTAFKEVLTELTVYRGFFFLKQPTVFSQTHSINFSIFSHNTTTTQIPSFAWCDLSFLYVKHAQREIEGLQREKGRGRGLVHPNQGHDLSHHHHLPFILIPLFQISTDNRSFSFFPFGYFPT